MELHDKLFIPGPVEVSEKTLAAFSRPMIGHRGEAFKELYASIQPRLQALFGTRQPVFLATCSASGVMEAAIRNLVRRRVLCCMGGAFSDRWLEIARRCGKEAEPLPAEWGSPIDPVALDAQLRTGRFDAVTMVHCETSTGVLNSLGELSGVLGNYPNVVVIVDAVSSLSAMPLPMDSLGIDLLLTASQKALALPPGLSLFSVSGKAFARAEEIPARGFYFDFLEFRQRQADDMTPTTPSIGHIFALQSKLDEIFAEGLTNRFARHARTNRLVHDWVRLRRLSFFAPEGCRAVTFTCVRNDSRIDVPKLVQTLRTRHHLVIDGGYGKLAGATFRISNMGDETEESVAHLIGCLEDCFDHP